MFTDAQLATAIDCEGYIGINRMNHKIRLPNRNLQHSAKVGLAMNHPAYPAALKVRFGGSMRSQHNPKGNQPIYRWELVGNKQTGPVLSTLLPYLVVKKQQAEVVLEFLCDYASTRSGHKHYHRPPEEMARFDSYWMKVKELNRPAPATTERDDPATGCDSLTSQETERVSSEVKTPIQ